MKHLLKLSLLLGFYSYAGIFLDLEKDPLPFVEMKVILPIGFETSTESEAGHAALFSDMLESGTAQLERQEFLEKLADYGATQDFSVGGLYSEWSLNFPLIQGKDYTGLIEVLSQNWNSPRFDQKNFDKAKLKLESQLKGSLDRDFSLASGALRRWLSVHQFGGSPLFLENLGNLTLEKAKTIYDRDFLKVPSIWVGAVAPEHSLDLIRKLVQGVFKFQGSLKEGVHLKKMSSKSLRSTQSKPVKLAIVVDKASRTQTITTAMSIGIKDLAPKNEVTFNFGNHVFFNSGLGSVFGDEIRNKRGLAYSVGSAGDSYLEKPMISIGMNPVRERTDEALGVLSELLTSSFVKGDLIKNLPDEIWNRQWKSFRAAYVLSRSTPSSRLLQRAGVVTGELSPEYYKSKPQDWFVSRELMAQVFTNIWNNSSSVIGFVGDAKELSPIISKHFPDYQIKVVPYEKTISSYMKSL